MPVVLDPSVSGGDDDVLGQPSRRALFELLVELKRPAGTAELARRMSLHPNGVRLHLERMELAPKDAGEGTAALERAFAALGFAAAAQVCPGGQPDRVVVCLGNCPYRDVVRENQPRFAPCTKGSRRGCSTSWPRS